MTDATETMLAVALRYIGRGWHVFPLHSIVDGRCTCGNATCSDAGKHPRTQRGLKEASKDRAQIETWFGPDAPLSNIGLATGAASGITVLDIDIGEGKDGAATWAALIEGHGEPQTLMANTGSGGIHVFFKYNSVLKTSSNTLGKNVDCRNDGGYVVAAPSMHRSGRRYSWEDESMTIADLPPHLSRRPETRGRKRKDDPTRFKYGLEQVAHMLTFVPADDRDLWRATGIILGREFNTSDEAWGVYNEWSNKWKGTPGRDHNEKMHEAFYTLSQQAGTHAELSIGTIIHHAKQGGWVPKVGLVPIEHFLYYGPGNSYIYRPTGSFWIEPAVNAACSSVNENGNILRASDWLKANRLCTSMTNDPVLNSDFERGVDYRDGAVVETEGAATFNAYCGPTVALGDSKKAGPYLCHVRKVFNKPGDADQFLDYMAHRAQRPEEKPRFALLIAGDQGVGKDTAVEFCIHALGPWNVANVEPADMESNFNEHARAVLVRVSEAANVHDMGKWAFNERLKVLIAGTPDYVQINPKYGHKYSVRLHNGTILTTNHMITGMYIPQDDRRYDVIEAATKEEMGLTTEEEVTEYFTRLWAWYNNEDGASHIAAFLDERDLSKFSAANGQRKTAAHRLVVGANLSHNHWLVEALMQLGVPKKDDPNGERELPELVRTDTLTHLATRDGERTQIEVGKVMQKILVASGYVPIVKPGTQQGLWYINGKAVAVYGLRAKRHDVTSLELLEKIKALPTPKNAPAPF